MERIRICPEITMCLISSILRLLINPFYKYMKDLIRVTFTKINIQKLFLLFELKLNSFKFLKTVIKA